MKKETVAFAAENGVSSASYTVDHSILTIRNGQYYLDQYVTIADNRGQETGTVIPVPIT